MESTTQSAPSHTKTIITIAVLAIVVIILALVAGKSRMMEAPAPDNGQVMMEDGTNLPPVSENNDTASLESDLNTTDFSEIDADLKTM